MSKAGGTSVGIVLLDLDQHDVTFECLMSIAENVVSPEVVVLVENGEEPLSERKIDQLRQEINLVKLHPEANLGCAGGRNIGLNYLRDNTEVNRYMILDNDTILPKEFIGSALEIEMEPLDVVAPVTVEPSGDGAWCGGEIELDGSTSVHRTIPGQDTSPVEVDWAPGACLIMHEDAWKEVGGFDEWMNFYFEDTDWCVRLRQAGGRVLLHPDLRIEHKKHHSLGGEGSPERTRLWSRNGTVFRLWRLDIPLRPSARWIIDQIITAGREMIVGNRKVSIARLRGLSEGIAEIIKRRQQAGNL